MHTVVLDWRLGLVLTIFVVAAAILTRAAEVGSTWAAPIAALRAVVQLSAVSLIIAVVLRSLWLTAAFLTLMVLVAAATSAQRITGRIRPRHLVTVLPIAGGVLPALVVILISGVLPLQPIAVLPTAGILIGGAMTATSIAGRRVTEELTSQRGVYEAARSLGMNRRDSVSVVARPAAGLALVPGLDQTRTVGLVTLPGAFVGVLLAGAPPVQAGAVQALVLISLLLVQAIAVSVTVELVSAGWLPVGDGALAK